MTDFIMKGDMLTAYVGPGGDIILPKYVRFVQVSAFRNCNNIRTITLPDKIFNLPAIYPSTYDTFLGFITGPNNSNYSTIDGVVFDKRRKALVYMPPSKTGTYIVPGNVECIDRVSFLDSRLSRVIVSSGVKKINQYAFYRCPYLEKVTLPDTIQTLEYRCFFMLPKLKSLIIPANITTFKSGTVSYCNSISHISFKGDNIQFTSGSFNSLPNLNCIILAKDKLISSQPHYKKALAIGIIRKKYNGQDVDDEVWDSVRKYINQVKKVINWVELIPHYKFLIPFLNDEGILSDDILDQTITNSLNNNNEELTVKLLDIKEEYFPSSEQFDRMMAKAELRMKEAEKRRKYEIKLMDHNSKEYIRSIWKFSPYMNKGIIINKYKGQDKDVIVPEYILGKKVIAIGEFAFSSARGKGDYINFLQNELHSVTIPDSVEFIGRGAFQDCHGLDSVKLPNRINNIPCHAFNGCINLTTVKLNDKITSIDEYAFHNCTSLRDFQLPQKLQKISSYAFSGCSDLYKVIIPDTVTDIESGAYKNCTSLYSIKLSPNMSIISYAVFNGCQKLHDVYIPFVVKELEIGAFWSCNNLSNIWGPIETINLMKEYFPNTTYTEI